MGRATSGVRIIKLQPGDRVSAIAKLIEDQNKVEGDSSDSGNSSGEEGS